MKPRYTLATSLVFFGDMVPKASKDLLSTGEAAAILGTTRQHVVNLCSQGILPFVMVGTHRRVHRDDVLELAGRDAADRGGPMTRDRIRTLWLHRVAAGHVARSPGKSIARARRRIRALIDQDAAGSRWLEDWDTLTWEGPEAVMREMVNPAPHARELRQNSPWLGLLTRAERESTLSAFEQAYPPRRRDDATRPDQGR
jgi:excisionase family DNA binding protein